jgi:ribose transport system ATP-binding protein
MDDNVLLKVEGIIRDFPGTRALSDVTFEVKKGEIHGLIGKNGAGKSTLMNIISGVVQPTKGKIFFNGKETVFTSPNKAQNAGISFVHQELSLCPNLSVAENIFIGRLPKKKSGLIDRQKLYKDCREILNKLKSEIVPWKRVNELNVAQQQIVELAKSLSLKSKLLIFDEPTSCITKNEADILFEIIDNLKKTGIGILYISHRLTEIFDHCDRITVLRDGHLITTVKTDEQDANFDSLIYNMVGREIKNMYADKSTVIGDELLRVEGLKSEGVFDDMNFNLKQGEILGFSGLIGAGRTEAMRALCGIDPKTRGDIFLHGNKIEINNYSDAIKTGIAYVTEDRKNCGLFLNLSILINVSAASLYGLKNGLLIDPLEEEKLSKKFIKELNVKVSDLHHTVNSLSGGNQQKVLLAKWLASNPKIIIMDEPTKGIDIGAKVEIYRLLRDLADSGVGVIMISSELPEIVGVCDRVVVMHEGKIIREFNGDDIQEQTIMMYGTGKSA